MSASEESEQRNWYKVNPGPRKDELDRLDGLTKVRSNSVGDPEGRSFDDSSSEVGEIKYSKSADVTPGERKEKKSGDDDGFFGGKKAVKGILKKSDDAVV